MQCLPIVAPPKQRRKIRLGGLVSHIGDTDLESRPCLLDCTANKTTASWAQAVGGAV